MRKTFTLLLPIVLAVGCTANSAGQDMNEDTDNVTTYNNESTQAGDNTESNSAENPLNDLENQEADKEKYIDMLDDLDEELESLEEKAEEGSQEEMDESEDELYERWDVALNEVYDALRSELSDEEKEKLRKKQRDWVEKRDEYAKEEAVETENDDESYSFILTEAKKEFTKERCYDLVEEYME